MNYVPLNIKTHNSLLTSMIKISELVKMAKENGLTALTITDNNMYGTIDFYKACIKAKIKPIIGLEVKIPETIILYARNYAGYQNLMHISTIMTERDISQDDLYKYHSNLVCIVPYTSRDKYNEIKKIYEYIFIGYKNDLEKEKIKASNKVYMHEILCLYKEDEKYLKYLSAIKTGTIEENFKDVSLLPLKNIEEKNNHLINELCNLKLKFHQDLLPKYTNDNAYEMLKKACIKGMKKIFGASAPKKYAVRLKYELSVIKKMGFCDYFLIVADYINYAKTHGVLVGPGRGSAAGSLVSYVLGITTIDPLKYDLLFERFLNPERVTMPDIDVDFEDSKRGEVINYCIHKYGMKKVASIITFGTLGPKQAVRDVARVLNISLKKTDELVKFINTNLSLEENLKNKKIENFLNINSEFKEVYNIALKFEGLKRHTSLHAAGIVMSKYDLDDYIPLDKSHKDFYSTEFSMEYLEEIGLLKMDFLGLKNLSLIANILKEVNLKFDDIPEDDPKTLKIFTNVNTLGIFQFESSGMVNFLKKFKPETFEEIVVALALFRPGPMKNIDLFIKRRNGEEQIDYMHPDLEGILRPTYGIIIYQEQIMKIASVMAGFSYGEADILRRAMSKKKEDVLLKEREHFIKGALNNGYDKKLASKIYELISRFASYGFNRSHAVSYAMISYRMAYLKAHYPKVFMKHLLSSVQGSEVKTKEYLYECRKLGLKVAPPNINLSEDSYIIKNDKIIFPFGVIKGFGMNVTLNIIEERKKGKFKDVFDFTRRCNVGIKTLEKLILAGAFNGLGYNKKTLINNLEVINNYGEVGVYLEDDIFKPELELEPEFTSSELMKSELDLFGFYISESPVTMYKKRFSHVISLEEITNYFDKNIEVVGMVTKMRKIMTKNKEEMMFLTISDEIGKAEVVLFPKVYQKVMNIKTNDILYIKGKVKKRFADFQIEAGAIKKVE